MLFHNDILDILLVVTEMKMLFNFIIYLRKEGSHPISEQYMHPKRIDSLEHSSLFHC